MPAFYTRNPEENYFNQNASLYAQYRWTKLVGQFESDYSIAREGNRELNTITTSQSFRNALRFQYDYSEKTSFDLQLSQSASIVESFQNNYQYEAKAGMNYQMFPKTSLGLEGAGGILDQTSSPLQYYQQARVRINYVATGKLQFKLSGGVEVREFHGTDVVRVNPVFNLGLEYRPFDGTILSIIGYRHVEGSSVLAGQDIIATGFDIAVTQRFLQKFRLGLSFGYENDVYFSNFPTEEGTDTDRVDNYLYVRPTLDYSFVRWVSVNIFYEFRRNVSTQDMSSFYGNRVGVQIATEF
jgi:hypothetical protein